MDSDDQAKNIEQNQRELFQRMEEQRIQIEMKRKETENQIRTMEQIRKTIEKNVQTDVRQSK